MVKYVSALTDTDAVKNGFGDAGDTVTYSYKVINPGPLGLSGLTATDAPLGPIAGCPATLAAGAVTAAGACDPKTVIVSAGGGSPLTNTATVTARLPSGLVPFGDHADGTPPYSYNSDMSDPILQIMDPIDGATQNGSEQIYLPGSSWRPSTKVLAWDPDQPDLVGGSSGDNLSLGEAAALAYGRGFGDPTNGLVMYQAGHDFTRLRDGRRAGGSAAHLHELQPARRRGPLTRHRVDDRPGAGAVRPERERQHDHHRGIGAVHLQVDVGLWRDLRQRHRPLDRVHRSVGGRQHPVHAHGHGHGCLRTGVVRRRLAAW